MDDKREERIRRRAHALWEEEGRPDGKHDEHWDRARQEFERGADSNGNKRDDSPVETAKKNRGVP